MDLVAIYGAGLSTAIAVIGGFKFFYDRWPRLEINPHIPESIEYTMPILEGVIPEDFSIEETIKQLGKIEANETPEKIQEAMRIITDVFIHDPREAHIRIYVRNCCKKTINIVSFKIIMKTNDRGEKCLRTYERNQRVSYDEQIVEYVKIGDLLNMLRPYDPNIDDELKITFLFKDEKQRSYKRKILFDYEEWTDRVDDYKITKKKADRINKRISQIFEYILDMQNKAPKMEAK